MRELLAVTQLSHAYDGAAVLEQVSFGLGPGERLTVLGPSGSGKTTLLRLIAGLDAPVSGAICILGQLASGAGEVLIAPQRREVAMVFQGLALFPHLNALEQIAFAARGRGGMDHAKKLLASIGLPHRASARLDQLSGGERQRIALARALAQEPKLILMDEPFASLDDEKRAEMRDLLRALLDQRETTLILVTHSKEDAFNLGKKVLVLESGRLRAFAPLEEAMARPRHSAVVRALGLGQLVQGEIVDRGQAQTPVGVVAVANETPPGRVQILIRPGQPKIVSEREGTEVEVSAVETSSPDVRERRQMATVQAKWQTLRLMVSERALAVGERIHIRINGECDVVEE